MCHLLEQLTPTLGLPSWTRTDPGHFLWMPISSEYKYSREAASLLAQIMPLLSGAGVQGLLDYGAHWFRTFSVGITSGFFFFPLTSGVYPFTSPSTPRSERESEENKLADRQSEHPKKLWQNLKKKKKLCLNFQVFSMLMFLLSIRQLTSRQSQKPIPDASQIGFFSLSNFRWFFPQLHHAAPACQIWSPLITNTFTGQGTSSMWVTDFPENIREANLPIRLISVPSSFGRTNMEAAFTYIKWKRRCW